MITVQKALDNTFYEFTLDNEDTSVDPVNGLNLFLALSKRILVNCLQRFNCLKFYLVCNARFQVIFMLSTNETPSLKHTYFRCC